LIDALCTASLITHSPEFYTAGNFTVDNVDFTLQHRVAECGQQVAIYADLGPLPAGQRTDLLLSLRGLNLQIFHSGQDPVLSYNPNTRHLLLMGAVDLSIASTQSLLLVMKAFARLAIEWRSGEFQGDGSRAAAGISEPLQPARNNL
jgi:hypothetical protein